MSELKRQNARPARRKPLLLALLGAAALVAAGCVGDRDDGDGEVVNNLVLPTDVVLDLHCEDVGVHPESCVLDDPANPFATTTIIEFDLNNPGAENKFELLTSLPPGPAGAKARFYLWATALARQPSGENQYFTALALHELFDANSNAISQDELVREQALKAYRSVLENFFSSVTVFTCCAEASPDGEPVPFPVPLNELTADNLFRTDATGFRRLVPGDPILAQEVLLDWGFAYQPATDDPRTEEFDRLNGVVSVIGN